MGFNVTIKSEKWIHWPDDIHEPFTSNSEDFSYSFGLTKYNKELDGCYLTVLPKFKQNLHDKVVFNCVYEIMYEIKFNGEKLAPELLTDIAIKSSHPNVTAAFDEKKKEKWFYGALSIPAISQELFAALIVLSKKAFVSADYK